jgi:hypothetical protein
VERFLEHGEVEIDNNKVENSIRPTAVGKRNWLFFGSEEAGQRNAVIYTLDLSSKTWIGALRIFVRFRLNETVFKFHR